MSTRLYIMRHATALPHGTAGYTQDHARPLTSEGFEEACAVAKGLRRLKIQPGRILTSPYVRARQTAEEVQRILAPKLALEEMASLKSEAQPEETCKDLKAFEHAEELLLVGHEPHLSHWVAFLVDPDGAAQCLMKKAGVACVEVEHLPPGQGRGVLRWLMTPKHLALIGSSQ